MTNLSDFTDDEIAQILDAPGAVLKGATLADGQPGAVRFLREAASGSKAFKEAQRHENEFVRAVALRLRDRVKQGQRDRRAAASPDDVAAAEETEVPDQERPDPRRETSHAIELSRAATTLVRDRAATDDADAYAAWLVRIATRVAKAARVKEGGVLSKRVTPAGGKSYIEQIQEATRG